MAKHRAKSRPPRIRALLAIVLTAAAATLIDASAAGSAILATPPNKVVYSKNTTMSARCALTVTHVDVPSYTTTIKIGAQQYPVDLAGYQTIAFSQPFCQVWDSTHTTLLAHFEPFKNAATRPWTSANAVLPYDSSYIVCAQGFAKLKNGDSVFGPDVCA